ncbi:MAG: HUIPC motif thioredoxin-like (seleno)protein [Desulforhopalus sp.]
MSDAKIYLEVIHEGPHCIPCEYMAKVVETVAPEFGDKLHWEKVIITRRKGAFRYDDLCKSMGRLPPVPSIFINGELVFDITPGPEKLRDHLLSLLPEIDVR